MALAYRTKAQSSKTTSNPITVNFTTQTGDCLLVVLYSSATTAARTGGAPTWNGVAMTQVGTAQAGSGECNSEMWYLVNPAIGSYTVSVPNSGNKESRVMVAVFTGTEAVLFGNTQTGTSSATPSLTINNVPAGSICVSVIGHGHKNPPTARSHTVLYENDEGEYQTCSQYTQVASQGNITMSWTFGGSDDVAMIMAAFKEISVNITPSTLSLALTQYAPTIEIKFILDLFEYATDEEAQEAYVSSG